jgi:heat shock protein HslJ
MKLFSQSVLSRAAAAAVFERPVARSAWRCETFPRNVFHSLIPLLRRSSFAGVLGLFALCLIAGCRSMPPPAVTWSLSGTVWKLVELDGEVVPEQSLPTLQLDAAATRASGFGGVNRYSGTYSLAGASLSFGSLAATKMAGSPEQMKLEDRFLRALGTVNEWKIEGPTLSLLSGGKVIARFQGMPG